MSVMQRCQSKVQRERERERERDGRVGGGGGGEGERTVDRRTGTVTANDSSR